ncbi:MAG TPA: leucine--tRNA ligase [Thermoleophilaceae bacterium]
MSAPDSQTTSTPAGHRYDAALANAIEAKWRERWATDGVFLSPNPRGELAEPNHGLTERPKLYVLDMFPYPSGEGLHVGHPLGYIATDIYARFKRMAGFNVLHTMGYDAFGLPAERYAVDTGQHPEVTTRNNVANMGRQLHRIGLGHDERRGVSTTDVEFYRWTQWVFLQIYDSWYDEEADRARPVEELVAELDAGRRGLPDGRDWRSLDERERRRAIDAQRLAYLDEVTVNWCPALGTVLANEEVTVDGRSEEGNFPVYRRPLRQWMLRITAYADRLVEDLAELEWSDSLKAMQTNWVGRSPGAVIRFGLEAPGADELEVFTTRPDTLFGATFVAIAPEHPLLEGDLPAETAEACAAYREEATRRSDRQRQVETEPSGVYTGLDAIHPLTGERVPIYAADYVLIQYGSGAVMGVPAHDSRDHAFARAFGLPIPVVVQPPPDWLAEHGLSEDTPAAEWPDAYTGAGTSVNSGPAFDGRPTEEAHRLIVEALVEAGRGERRVGYKLRDWLFSRQRYWGEPFPIVYDEHGDPHAIPDSMLPVELPELEDFAPVVDEDSTAEPEPPLARAADWVEVELDLGDGPKRYRRETNTMPQWAGSCWYYIRYVDPRNHEAFADPDNERYWLSSEGQIGGVDLYVGGVEHAVLHLLYARFWHKVLYDLGHVSSPEPFQRLFNQGMVQAAAYTDERGFYVNAAEVEERDGRHFHGGGEVTRHYGKMGKSLKNGVSPDEIIDSYGADALRLYEMFLGPLDQNRPWETQGITGVARFLRRVWRMVVDPETGDVVVGEGAPPDATLRALHRTIATVRSGIDRLHFNTGIAALMELSNDLRDTYAEGAVPRQVAEWFVLALAPFAPHMCEELWERLGHTTSLVYATYPDPDPALLEREVVTIAVQVNGKLRGSFDAAPNTDRESLEETARGLPNVASHLSGRTVKRAVVVPGRLVNFVTD